MCKKAACDTCNKSTWWGCGKHVSGVMNHIPTAEWCTCTPGVIVDDKTYPPMGTLAAA
ncbi:GTP-binding protein [Stagonosporopsis vannaccii]|nr:GTP-binding protein [Stagonosporopsis vannaccii]